MIIKHDATRYKALHCLNDVHNRTCLPSYHVVAALFHRMLLWPAQDKLVRYRLKQGWCTLNRNKEWQSWWAIEYFIQQCWCQCQNCHDWFLQRSKLPCLGLHANNNMSLHPSSSSSPIYGFLPSQRCYLVTGTLGTALPELLVVSVAR